MEISVSDLRVKLKEVLAKVAAGETILVIKHGKPVASICAPALPGVVVVPTTPAE